jgi:SsrA-binding protein
MAGKKKQSKPRGVRITNRRARRDYHIHEIVECGLELLGTEAKSLRAGQAKIDEAFARIDAGQVYLLGANIALYPLAAEGMQHNPTRKRKLLLHRQQINQLRVRTEQKGRTLVPLTIYFKKGWAKCELGIVEGKRKFDKRETLKKKQQDRDIQREMNRRKK